LILLVHSGIVSMKNLPKNLRGISKMGLYRTAESETMFERAGKSLADSIVR